MRSIKNLFAAVAATGLVAAPVAALANPASSLSVAKSPSVRAATNAEGSELSGAAVFPLIAVVAIIAVGVYLIVDNENSDSN